MTPMEKQAAEIESLKQENKKLKDDYQYKLAESTGLCEILAAKDKEIKRLQVLCRTLNEHAINAVEE